MRWSDHWDDEFNHAGELVVRTLPRCDDVMAYAHRSGGWSVYVPSVVFMGEVLAVSRQPERPGIDAACAAAEAALCAL